MPIVDAEVVKEKNTKYFLKTFRTCQCKDNGKNPPPDYDANACRNASSEASS